ncbi:MAG: STAS domain-containing protein [Planctomycetota bacterium]|nr:STAS domain-containing protein [Planctomycetota bacterium]MEC8560814.1 STAS domain-containing protein [Planctomycetota bacterium]MEC9156642.1 STAS domain-containing protein [Planctomycetota bacterium]MEC9232992.1 STAS domain-containing protein [Planctomycetota bacterium]MED5507127.1 STAS domain-containing protein [Planctomycetota bacterium]
MPIEEWSEEITIATIGDEPAFSEDMGNLLQRLGEREDSTPDVILDLSSVSYLNSSNIAQMLRLRKRLNTGGRNMRICSVDDQVWGVLMITGLDKIFDFTDDVSTALASLQLSE